MPVNATVFDRVCGEMAGDPNAVPLLIGLGVNELSVAPTMLHKSSISSAG